MEFIYITKTTAMHYAAISAKPALRGRVLATCFPPQTATTMLTTAAALTLQATPGQATYMKDPLTCQHESGARSYGAAGVRVKICDLCGSRWVMDNQNKMARAVPKAHPTAKTPLGVDLAVIKGTGKNGVAPKVGSRGSLAGLQPPSAPLQPRPKTTASTTSRRTSNKQRTPGWQDVRTPEEHAEAQAARDRRARTREGLRQPVGYGYHMPLTFKNLPKETALDDEGDEEMMDVLEDFDDLNNWYGNSEETEKGPFRNEESETDPLAGIEVAENPLHVE